MKETEIQSAIIDYLQILENQNKLFFVRLNNIPPVTKLPNGKMLFRRMPKGTKKGLADILLIIKGQAIFLEVKSESGYLRTEQKQFQELCKRNSTLYFVVRSVIEVENIIKTYAEVYH